MATLHDAPKAATRQPGPGKLILVRHTESAWNVLGKWTGRTNVHLTPKGRREAAQLGKALADIRLDYAYSSQQVRTTETLKLMLKQMAGKKVTHHISPALNERDYGDYTGLNKWDVLEQLGEDVFTEIRRGWNEPVPNGETLKMVYDRSLPFYKSKILPKLLAGKSIMIVAHGNSLRSLIKYLEGISDSGISQVEMSFGYIYIYRIGKTGRRLSKEVRKIDIVPPNA